MKHQQTIRVPKPVAQALQAFLDGPGDGGDAVQQTFSADFGDGYEADIKVVDGDTPYVDPVLFHNGNEVAVGEPADCLLGEYHFNAGGDEFVVNVVVA